jgi:hypothetical protein
VWPDEAQSLWTHGPLWFELLGHLSLVEDGVPGQTADSTSATANSLLLNG